MRVAFTSSDGVVVDEHFGRTASFFVWEVEPERAAFVEEVSAIATSGATEGDEEDRTNARAAAVAGCAIVYTVAVGGPAAAKLVARRVHPMKTAAPVPVAELVSRLQGVLRGTPPPWLRKAMSGRGPAPDAE
jgi:nitrogen fixation protein NifX